jgi:hypothetical protein
MIRLTRVRTTPPIHKNFYGAARVAANLALMKKKRDGELESASEAKWDSAFWKKAKKQLLVETSGKCAYCETPTSVVDYGDVEHFRPKSKYWWLAYSYENYLASCAICNQKFKSDDFLLRNENSKMPGPIIHTDYTDERLKQMAAMITVDPVTSNEGMPYEIFEDQIQSEWALLVNPYFEDPEEFYAYTPIIETQEVHVVPTKKEYKDVVRASEDLFGINRTELLNLRFQWYCLYMTFRHSLADPGITSNTAIMNQNQINNMKKGNMPYTGMVRYLETQQLNDLPWKFDLQFNTLQVRQNPN